MTDGVRGTGQLEAVGRVDDLAPNSMKSVVLANGDKVCLVRTDAGICALVDRCSHRDFPLSSGEVTPGGLIECSWHGAQFDPMTGVMLTGPGGDDVKRYDVRIDGETITIDPMSAH
ncbi:MAG TPA: Rieske (2Fe-2S) protein [Gemmatimonadaceae bacterium]|nr:Rieske (2Fe-2S) protein [Gemmatimonadaceae bacterium]